MITLTALALLCVQDDSEYYPLAVGHRWVYHVTAEGERLEEEFVECVILRSDKIERIPVYEVVCASTSERLNVRQTVSIGSDGLRVHQDQGGKYSPSLLALPMPLKPGERWESRSAVNAFTVVLKGRIGEEESVGVHAGAFSARKSSVTFEILDRKDRVFDRVETHAWYARKVGLVKYEIVTKTGRITLRLASFTPADPNAEAAAREWFPTSNNLVWHYLAHHEDRERQEKVSLEMKRSKSEQIPTYLVRKLDERGPSLLEVSAGAAGLRIHAIKHARLKPPLLVATFPLKAGAKIESSELDPDDVRILSLVEGEEKVTVKAGEFATMRLLISIRTRADEIATVTIWLARGVGIVKAKVVSDGRASTLELTSFEK